MFKALKDRYFNYLNGFHYELGLVKIDKATKLCSEEIVNQIVWVKGCPKTSWFADPFIYKVTDSEIHIFVEEWPYSLGRGVISLVVVDKASFHYKRHKELLRLETHLSWPFIVREGEQTYVIPENSASGQIKRYIYDDEQESLTFDRLVADEPFMDPVFFKKGTEAFCLSSIPCDIRDTLHLFKENPNASEEDLYVDTGNIIKFELDLARAAGGLFSYKGNVYKPNQIGIENYGEGIILFKQTGDSSYEEVVRLYPKDKKHAFGIHTFNVFEDYLVVDGEGARFYYLRKCLLLLSKLFPFLPKAIRE